ncbi:MAG: protease inhibitor I42 family protein [Nitrospirales bacterium]|jgi:predicted secreted protein
MNTDQVETKAIQVFQSATFVVHLWEDRTRGEQWVPTYDPKTLGLMGDEFLRTVSNNAVDSGRRSFEFQALQPGSHRLEFSKRMAWKFTAEDRRVFQVIVLPTPS